MAAYTDSELVVDGEMAALWARLSMDEKSYLNVCHIFPVQADAARRIGKNGAWLKVAKKRVHFKRALEIKDRCSDSYLERLLVGDTATLLTVDMAMMIHSADQASDKDKFAVARAVAQLVRQLNTGDGIGRGGRKIFRADDLDQVTGFPSEFSGPGLTGLPSQHSGNGKEAGSGVQEPV